MLTLWLARHGETPANARKRYQGWSDQPLTPRGERQAERLRERLTGVSFDKVIASDLGRAVRTADIACPGHPVIATAALREVSFGQFEGLTYAQARRSHPAELDTWLNQQQAPPGGEALREIATRVTAWYQEIGGQIGTFVVIAHGGSLRILLCLALGLPVERYWQFRLDPCTLSRLDVYESGAILSLLNDASHLGELA